MRPTAPYLPCAIRDQKVWFLVLLVDKLAFSQHFCVYVHNMRASRHMTPCLTDYERCSLYLNDV